jgi:hypothetical protein
VVAKKVADGAVLVDLESGRCWELNRTGQWIWERICAGESLDLISSGLADDGRVALSTAQADVRALVRELAEARLILVDRHFVEQSLP